MKSRWAFMLLCVPALAFSETVPGQDQNNPTGPGAAPDELEEYSYNWVDSGHAYATDRAQELTQWMDSFFRSPNYQFEQAESQLRLQTRQFFLPKRVFTIHAMSFQRLRSICRRTGKW